MNSVQTVKWDQQPWQSQALYNRDNDSIGNFVRNFLHQTDIFGESADVPRTQLIALLIGNEVVQTPYCSEGAFRRRLFCTCDNLLLIIRQKTHHNHNNKQTGNGNPHYIERRVVSRTPSPNIMRFCLRSFVSCIFVEGQTDFKAISHHIFTIPCVCYRMVQRCSVLLFPLNIWFGLVDLMAHRHTIGHIVLIIYVSLGAI